MKNKTIYRLVLSALFIALGIVLPFFTGQIPEIGNMLLPMHLPVLLCGLICGWKYGLAVGFLLPLMRSLMFGMPVIFPSAVGMAFELSAYGFLIGFLFQIIRKRSLPMLYAALVSAMAAGRVVWGGVMIVLMQIDGGAFTFSAFVAGAVLKAIPGIILQLVLIPSIMMLLDRTHLFPWRGERGTGEFPTATSDES